MKSYHLENRETWQCQQTLLLNHNNCFVISYLTTNQPTITLNSCYLYSDQWHKRFQEMKEYVVIIHGDCNAQCAWPLGIWVGIQRNNFGYLEENLHQCLTIIYAN